MTDKGTARWARFLKWMGCSDLTEEELTRFETMQEPIKVWAYREAPEEIRRQSPRWDDVDYLVLVPPGQDLPWGMERLDSCQDPGYCELSDGSTLYAMCHA